MQTIKETSPAQTVTHSDTLGQLREAALQLVIGFERSITMSHEEQISALQEASYALEEMRRAVDGLVVQHIVSSMPGAQPERTTDHTGASH